MLRRLVRLAVVAAAVALCVDSAPRYICGVGGNWRGRGVNDGIGWFEENIHGSESCDEFCRTKGHARCSAVCKTSDKIDETLGVCQCSGDLRREYCQRRGSRWKWKVCQCVMGGEDVLRQFQPVDTPRMTHQIFDFLETKALALRSAGRTTISKAELEAELRSTFLSRSDGVVFSERLLDLILATFEIHGDGLVPATELTNGSHRSSFIHRLIFNVSATERTADGGFYRPLDRDDMDSLEAYQPLDTRNTKRYRSSNGMFSTDEPSFDAKTSALEVDSQADFVNPSPVASPGVSKLLSSSPLVIYFKAFLRKEELLPLQRVVQRTLSEDPAFTTRSSLTSLHLLDFMTVEDTRAVLNTTQWRIFAETKIPRSNFERPEVNAVSSHQTLGFQFSHDGSSDTSSHVALFRIFLGDFNSKGQFLGNHVDSTVTLFPYLSLDESKFATEKLRRIHNEKLECQTDTVAEHLHVHHSAGGALLTYVRTPTADWVAPAATLVCGPTNVHSGVTSVWVDHWIAGAPVSQ